MLTRPTRVFGVVPAIELPLYENYVRLGGTIDLYSHPVDDAHIFVQDLHHEQMQRTNANPFNSGKYSKRMEHCSYRHSNFLLVDFSFNVLYGVIPF